MITMGNSSKVCGFVSMSSSNKSVCIKWLQQCLAHIGIICSPCCYCCFILTKCPHCHLKKFTFSRSYSMFYISMYAYACTYTYIHVHTHTHRLCFSHTRLTECLGKFHHSFMPILSFAIPSTWNSILLTYMTINFLLNIQILLKQLFSKFIYPLAIFQPPSSIGLQEITMFLIAVYRNVRSIVFLANLWISGGQWLVFHPCCIPRGVCT